MANHILIGIGGTGYNVLKEFRKRLWADVPDITERRKLPVRFLYVDSDDKQKPERLMGSDDLRVMGQDSAITTDEHLYIRDVNLNEIFDSLTSYPRLRHVIGNAAFVRNSIGEVGAAAGQKRRAGRILFAANAHNFNSKLTSIVRSLQDLGNANDLHIYVFAGLAGGTGSGSIVDVVAQIMVNYPDAELEVFAMIPEQIPPSGADAGRYHANGYAALQELSALNAGVYFPTDVATGAEHISVADPSKKKYFGLTVYTNINRNGATVDSYKVLPALVADVMYFRVFSKEGSEAINQLTKAFQSENRPDFQLEYRTDTKPGKPIEKARTKAVGSFGIKRILYPDAKLTAHVADSIARNVMAMMLYLNYDPDRGYIDEKMRNDAKDYGEYINKSNLKNWNLSDADLSLSVPIMKPTDGKMPRTFDDFWSNEVALDYSFEAAKDMGHPLQILDQYFDERYQGEFREEKGVEAYFQAKANDQVVTDSAEAIVANIRKSLFNKWVQGQLSAYDLKLVTEKILEMLQTKNQGLDAEIVEFESEIDKYVEDREIVLEEYNNVNWLLDKLGKKRQGMFVEYSKLLAEEYSNRTRLASARLFQKVLLPKLIQRFTELQGEIQMFLGRLEASYADYGILIGENTPEAEPDIRANVVEVSENARLSDFENKLRRDRTKMDTMAQQIRTYVADGAGNSFNKMAANISNRAKLGQMAETVLDELVASYHAEMMKSNPVLGLNVLEQLRERYGKDEDSIGRFASDIVRNSEVFITLNDQEVNKNMRNTENPTAIPAAGPNTIMVVAIPDIKTDDEELKRFIEVFKIKLGQAFNQTDTRKFFLTDSPKKNEITIITYQNIFPLRAISYMPFLKKKFDALTASPDETKNISNRILLFSEGDGMKLPSLEGEGEGPAGDDIIKYIFLATAMGMIKEGEDEYGNKGWGLVVEDDFGAEFFTLLSQKFTEIITSPAFTPEVLENLVEKVDEDLKVQKHVQTKAERAEKVKSLMKDKVLPEVGTPTHEMYRRYAGKAREAMETVQK